MKSFLEFLLESDIKQKNAMHYTHDLNVEGHSLHIDYRKNVQKPKEEEYSVDFDVNRQRHRGSEGSSGAGRKVLLAVHGSIGKFLKIRPVTKLMFMANSDRKHVLYKKVANKIAKAHGASVESDSFTHTITFKGRYGN